VSQREGSVVTAYSDEALKSIASAIAEARLDGSSDVGIEHILFGLVGGGAGIAGRSLESLGLTMEALGEAKKEPRTYGRGLGSSPPFSVEAKRVLWLALHEASYAGRELLGTGDILLAIAIRQEQAGSQILSRLNLVASEVRSRVQDLLEDPGLAGIEKRGDDDGYRRSGIANLSRLASVASIPAIRLRRVEGRSCFLITEPRDV
jgi:ATP-dependent Clp protease ATP-binding subunit ClpC